MRHRLIVAAFMLVSPAVAKDSILSCFAQTNNTHVVIMGSGGDAKIQWDGQEFTYGTAQFTDDRYLLIQQFGNKGTFRLVYDTKTLGAYGGTTFYDGHEVKSAFNCTWQ